MVPDCTLTKQYPTPNDRQKDMDYHGHPHFPRVYQRSGEPKGQCIGSDYAMGVSWISSSIERSSVHT
jgi:hypothetical protein